MFRLPSLNRKTPVVPGIASSTTPEVAELTFVEAINMAMGTTRPENAVMTDEELVERVREAMAGPSSTYLDAVQKMVREGAVLKRIRAAADLVD